MTEAVDLESLRRQFDAAPYATLLGMRVVELAPRYAKVDLRVRPEFANFAGLLHGGVVMSLADHAFGCALNTLGRLYVAVQFNVHILAGANAGEVLTAEGRVLHAGRTTGLGDIEVRGEDGRLVAKATGTVVSLSEQK